MGIVWPILLALATATLREDSALRPACGDGEPPLATLRAGQAVEVRFALAGGDTACYKVAATVDGRTLVGYVSGGALSGLEPFDQARRGGQGFRAGAGSPPADAAAIATRTARLAPDHPAARATALLDANQPAEALSILDRELARRPRDPLLLALAGLASYRADNLDRAALLFKESLDLAPDPALDGLYRKLLRERAADAGSERTVGERVIVRYERGTVDPDTARRMVAMLDDELRRIAGELGCLSAQKLTAIVQSPAVYRQATEAAEWSGGLYDGRIHVPMLEPGAGAGLRRTFAHELVHACLAQIGTFPVWLHEGLAQKLSGDSLPAPAKVQLKTLAEAKALPKLESMGRSWSRLSGQNAGLAYRLALAAAEELMANYAPAGLANVLRQPDLLPQITADLDRRLGL